MPSVQVTSRIEIDFEEVLQGISQLQMRDLERFVDRVIALQAQRRAPSLPKHEAELLQKINQRLPAEVRKRHEELNDKLHEETITPEEHQELLQLIDRLELADAERLQHLIELADIRHVTVDAVMSQLDIRRPAYV
jgi:hypothetical protein